jgi:hypothetical protein
MGETAGDIEDDIDHTRHALQANLEELEERMKALVDWRALVRRHPAPMMTAALAGGMLLAALIAKR